jgi:ubiquinone/menaquinone biosynthesis C-methylase UbiE
MNDLHYVGQELDIFAHARNWKRYWSSCVRPFLRGDVLEVGAGIGANTPLLAPQAVRSWMCIEPDPELASRAAAALAADPSTSACQVLVATTQTLPPDRRFDALLYIDVLEHIEQDSEELERAATLLKPGGSLIVLSPAHQWLYTAFDQSIGHFRRYDRAGMSACGPSTCRLERLWYLDSVGLLASCANRLFLKQSMPNLRQILFWDRYLVTSSTILDRVLAHSVGKSILAVWTKNA